LTPAAAASSIVMSGIRKIGLAAGQPELAERDFGRQKAIPSAVLAASWSGAVAMNSRYGVRRVTAVISSCRNFAPILGKSTRRERLSAGATDAAREAFVNRMLAITG